MKNNSRILKVVILISMVMSFVSCTGKGTDINSSLTPDEVDKLYENAVVDSMYAEKSEIETLVAITKEDDMTTWNDKDEVLLLTWHKYPDSYPTGEEITLEYGSIWTFTDKEICSWYDENNGKTDNYDLRLKQLIGLPPEDFKTHFTAVWVKPADIYRPAYIQDSAIDGMDINLQDDVNADFEEWFNGNIIGSYYNEQKYPWTRLGYTYDWADNETEYGLSEFLVKENSTVEVEFTMTTEEFIEYMEQN